MDCLIKISDSTKLSQLVDPLVKLNEPIDLEVFRAILAEKLHKASRGKGGRGPL